MTDSNEVLAQAEKLIPAEIRMISGCRDDQTSADVSNVASFQLPDPQGRAGGACTSAMLKILYADHKKPEQDLSFQEVLLAMRDVLSEGSYTQIPQLSSSRPLDVKQKFTIIPDNFSGNKYAVMIGINYVGQQGELSGCHNDVGNMKDYIVDVWGFSEDNITLLMDDGAHTSPTFDNILKAYQDVASKAQSGDAVFLHYSGHGGKLSDENNDEKDGYDETLVPLDYETAGQIRDDMLYKSIIGALAAGVTATSVMDCCHSGTVLDLPFVFIADGEHEGMTTPDGFSFNAMEGFAEVLGIASDVATAVNVASDCCVLL